MGYRRRPRTRPSFVATKFFIFFFLSSLTHERRALRARRHRRSLVGNKRASEKTMLLTFLEPLPKKKKYRTVSLIMYENSQ